MRFPKLSTQKLITSMYTSCSTKSSGYNTKTQKKNPTSYPHLNSFMLLTSYPAFIKPTSINLAPFHYYNSDIFPSSFFSLLFFFSFPFLLLEIHNTYYSLYNKDLKSLVLKKEYYYILSDIHTFSILF